jgi:hypothetical protein
MEAESVQNNQRHREEVKEADRQKSRHADKHAGRQADKQTGRQTDRKERSDLEKQGAVRQRKKKGRKSGRYERGKGSYAGKHAEDLIKGAEYEGVVALVHYERGSIRGLFPFMLNCWLILAYM